jgi:hypothetical protein
MKPTLMWQEIIRSVALKHAFEQTQLPDQGGMKLKERDDQHVSWPRSLK